MLLQEPPAGGLGGFPTTAEECREIPPAVFPVVMAPPSGSWLEAAVTVGLGVSVKLFRSRLKCAEAAGYLKIKMGSGCNTQDYDP